MRHKAIRILFTLLVLLLVAAAGVQVILFTDLPRRWILRAMSQELGMNVTAGSLRTDLWGRTIIRNFALSLPMGDGPILTIPEMHISHTSLPATVLCGSLRLRSVTVTDPTLNVRQDEMGSWNIKELASRLRASAQGSESNNRGEVILPILNIVNGTISVSPRPDQTEDVAPVRFYGGPTDTTRWGFGIILPSKVKVSGKVNAGGDWAHEIAFDVADLHELVENLIPNSPMPLSARGRLYGRVHGNELTTKLKLDRVQCGRTQAYGTVLMDISEEKLLVQLETLSAEGLGDPLKKIRVAGGSLRLDTEQLQAEHIGVETGGIRVNITGHWNWAAREGTLAGSWSSSTSKSNVSHEGTWNGSISWPQIGPRRASVSMTTQGSSPWGLWQGEANVVGSGNTWSTSRWHVSVPRLVTRRKGTDITLEDVRAEIATDWPNVQLVSLSAAGVPRLKAEGAFSASDRNWALLLEAEGLKPAATQGQAAVLRLAASGNREDITIKELGMSAEGMKIECAGRIDLPSGKLLDAQAKAFWMVPRAKDRQGFGSISGNLQCEAAITGTVRPLNLQVQSLLSGRNVTFNKKAVGSLTIPGKIQFDSRQIKYQTDPFQLFGGTWDMHAEHNLSERSTQLAVDANDALLQPMIELFDVPLACQGSVATHLEINLPWSDMNEVTVSGRWAVKEMIMPPIETDSVEGLVRIEDGMAAFDQIHLKRDQGMALASARFRLSQPQHVSVEVTAQQWPTSLPNRDVTFTTDGRGQVVLDLSKRTGLGTGHLSTSVAIDNRPFAYMSAEVAAEDRMINLNEITIDILGGTVCGAARIPLDDWLATNIELQWHDLETASLACWWAGLEGLTGRSSGSLTATKATGPRPWEPLHLEIHATIADGGYRGARIGDCQISAYLGKERLLIDQSEFELMDGILSASGNLRRRTGEGSAYVRADFSRIELDQLVHLFLPSAKPIQGRLSGKGMLVVLSDLRGMTGQANMQLSESDLARTVVVGTLYDAMNLKFTGSQPTGQGQINLRFEGSSLKIPSFVHFNRGVEIRGAGSIDDLTRGKMSPIKGYAISSIRPLKGIRLPGIQDLDRLMSSLQTGVSSVRIRGTLAEPQPESVPLREIGDALSALLWSQLGE